jgi:hypothetical protein
VAVDYVWLALLVVVMGGLWWLAYRMEPHWSSKDGRRFLCTTQDLSNPSHPGRPRETRIAVSPDGALLISRKNGLRRENTTWVLTGKVPEPPRKREVFLAERRGDSKARLLLAIRLPANSRCVAVLDRALAGKPNRRD